MDRRTWLYTGATALGYLSGCVSSSDEGTGDEKTQNNITISNILPENKIYAQSEDIFLDLTIKNNTQQEKIAWPVVEVCDNTGTSLRHSFEATTLTSSGSVTKELGFNQNSELIGNCGIQIELWSSKAQESRADLIAKHSTDTAFVVTGTATNACAIRGDAIYIWGPAGDIVTNETTISRAIDNLRCLGVRRVFLSWGALLSQFGTIEHPKVSEAIAKMMDAGFDVHLLWGLELGYDGIKRARSDIQKLPELDVGSLHLDLEPDPDGKQTTREFLQSYVRLLDEIPSSTTGISAFIPPYWFDVASKLASTIRDHEEIDSVVIPAYRSREKACRRQLQLGLSGTPQNPYYAAFEFQDPSSGYVNPEITLATETSDTAMSILTAIAKNPPVQDQFLGTALHNYRTVR